MDTVIAERDLGQGTPALQETDEPSGTARPPEIDFPAVLGMVRQKQRSEEAVLSITCDLMSHI